MEVEPVEPNNNGLNHTQTGNPDYRNLNLAIDEMVGRIADPVFRERFIFGTDRVTALIPPSWATEPAFHHFALHSGMGAIAPLRKDFKDDLWRCNRITTSNGKVIPLEALAFSHACCEARRDQAQLRVKLPDCKGQDLIYQVVLGQATKGADILDINRSDGMKFLTENQLSGVFSHEVTWCPTRGHSFEGVASYSYRIDSFIIGNEPLRFSPEQVKDIRTRLVREEGLDIPKEQPDLGLSKLVLFIRPPKRNLNQSLTQISKLCFGLSRYKYDEAVRVNRGRRINNHGRAELPNYLYLSTFLNRDGYGEEVLFPLEEDTFLDRLFLHTVVYSAVLDVIFRAPDLNVYLKASMGNRLNPSLVPLIAGHK